MIFSTPRSRASLHQQLDLGHRQVARARGSPSASRSDRARRSALRSACRRRRTPRSRDPWTWPRCSPACRTTPVEPNVRAWKAASTVGIQTCLAPSWSAASTAAGLIPPTARLSTIPPTTWIPGTMLHGHVRAAGGPLGVAFERERPETQRDGVPRHPHVVGDAREQVGLGVDVDVHRALHVDEWTDRHGAARHLSRLRCLTRLPSRSQRSSSAPARSAAEAPRSPPRSVARNLYWLAPAPRSRPAGARPVAAGRCPRRSRGVPGR